ncbi:MAG: flagellar basal-body rod protein FlgG [Phycisphaerales bacterium]|nr:flagellar basal-body rod protein FlgG [Phycisphaerales bacterium]
MAITALHTAATGMSALSQKIDVIANNIANADTVGFKSSRVNFQDALYQIRRQPGVQTSDTTNAPLGTLIGLGVLTSNTQIQFTQGSPMATGQTLDAMINGDGFFQVEMPDGTIGYTRAGNFIRNATGELVLGNSEGNRLVDTPTIPEDVPIDRISISSDGRISARASDGSITELGQIQLARFANPQGLLQNGANIFLESASSGAPVVATAGTQGLGTVQGGFLELSTTEAVTELVELIKTQRVFQMNSQTIETADQALQVVANLRR